MRDPFSRLLSSFQSQDSWLQRICENFHQLLTPARIFPSSANGATIHLLTQKRAFPASVPRVVSFLLHGAVVAAVLLVATRQPGSNHNPWSPRKNSPPIFSVPPALLNLLRGQNPNGGNGSGTGHDSLPPTQGNLPPRSSIQFLKPTIPANREPELPLPPTILDPSAPRILTTVDNVGLPWMPDRNNSSGRGKGNTIGDGPDDSIGSSPGSEAGVGGPAGRYQAGFTQPVCAYCPDPQYTDEAREAKLQGTVTLRVLVSADGRVSQARFVHGIGLGLDERALETVRGWKFVPARDAARRAIPVWITIEVVFRLI
jgi:periplasmic protein TonB